MTNDLHVGITKFRWDLNTFWKTFVNRPRTSDFYNLDTAARELRYHKDVLNQVLELRGLAQGIEGILDTQPLKGLNQKES